MGMKKALIHSLTNSFGGHAQLTQACELSRRVEQ